jgi:cell division protein FtsI/penicillin-binding protein 2
LASLVLFWIPANLEFNAQSNALAIPTLGPTQLRPFAQTLTQSPGSLQKPMEVSGIGEVRIQSSLSKPLQTQMELLMRKVRPKYGAFVALEADTGRVLALVGFDATHSVPKLQPTLALKATFPCASVFKIVTAAAAFEHLALTPESRLAFRGKSTTLFKRQVHLPPKALTQSMEFKEAFAKSVNPIFGRLGPFVGRETLGLFAYKLGFNRDLSADFEIAQSPSELLDTDWDLVESASGFTQNNKMSAVHGALLAATVVNNGLFLQPYLVDALITEQGQPIYRGRTRTSHQAIKPSTAHYLRTLMHQTLISGTSRKSFKRFFLANPGVLAGGKTGSLTSKEHGLFTDWFVGYCDKVAVAVMMAHDFRTQARSSHLARKAFDFIQQTSPL